MGLIDNIKNMFNRNLKLPLTHKQTIIGNAEVYAEVNTQRAIDRGYNANGNVYSIVSKGARKFGSIPRYVFNMEGKKAEEGKSKDLTKLLNRPNEYQGQDAFLSTVYSYYKITGESFVWLNRGDTTDINGQPLPDATADKLPVLEMYVLPSNYVTVKPDPENLWSVECYYLDVNGQKIKFRKNDIVHWKTINMNFDGSTRSHLRGFSPLTAGFRTLQANEDATNAMVRMYQNDGAKGIIFNTDFADMTPEQQSQLKNVIDSRINNNQAKGAIATLQGTWQHINLGTSAVDMQLLEGKNHSMKELCALLDVPYLLFDETAIQANLENAKKNWVLDTIKPDSLQFDDEINRILLKAFQLEGMCYIGSDFTDLPELQKDLGALTTSLSTAWWFTVNERRKMMNEEEFSDPLCNEIWVPSGLTPLSQLNDTSLDDVTNQMISQGLIPDKPKENE